MASGCGTLLQQLHHFCLDTLKIIQPQLGVFHNKLVTIVAVIVDKRETAVIFFRADLLKNAFPLEHHGQDKTGVGRRICLRNEAPKIRAGAQPASHAGTRSPSPKARKR